MQHVMAVLGLVQRTVKAAVHDTTVTAVSVNVCQL